MPWTKLDDHFWANPKIQALPSAWTHDQAVLVPHDRLGVRGQLSDARVHDSIPADQYTYLFRCVETGLVKIGRSSTPVQRAHTIALQAGVTIELLGLLVGDAHEFRLHREFISDRVRGEWFRPTAAIFDAFDVPTVARLTNG